MLLHWTGGKEGQMQESPNVFELLEELRKRTGKTSHSYKELSDCLDRKARQKGIAVFGQFELTPLCNFSCRMCYVHLEADQLAGQKVLPVETWKDLMRQACEAGMIHVTLTGGECLAYPGFDELFLYLQSQGCDVSILTNGFLLDDRRIEFFRQHKAAMIQVTLYGPNDDVYERVTGHRAFSTVLENVRKAIEAGLKVNLNVTPNRYLGEDALETLRISKSITDRVTVNAVIFPPREETGRSKQQDQPELDQFIRIQKLLCELNGREIKEIEAEKLPPAGGPRHECDQCGLQCGGARSGFVINWKGEMTPCNRLDRIRAYPLRDGFREAWSRLNREANNWPRVPECEGCAYKDVCFHCAANVLLYGEPGKQPTALCELTKYYVQHGLRQIPECEE